MILKNLRNYSVVGTVCLLLVLGNSRTEAAPYASGVTFTSPTAVSFTLNEPADSLAVSINGGPATFLDATTRGTKTFNLPSASATFSITAMKNDPVGFSIPTGTTATVVANGLSQPTANGGFRLISDDLNPLVRFNSPRGVTVATDPTNPQFGTAYIANSAAGTTATVVRNVGDGLYALKSDQSDAFGYGNTAQAAEAESLASASSPFRISVGGDRNVYIADFSDAQGGVYRVSPNLTGVTQVLAGVGGPATVPAGQNHGSTTAVFASGSSSGDLTLYTLDEDLTSGGAATDKNSLWRYDIGNSALPYAGSPTKLAGVLVPAASSDMERGSNGLFYLGQNRAAGNESGIFVLGADGSVLFSSLAASRDLLGNPAAVDIFRNIQGIAISPDLKYIAAMLNNSDVAVVPLDANGIPIIANRLVIDTGTDVNSGRDIAFDAVGNVHYVSSGQALYRVLSPGGFNSATTRWDGTSFSFTNIPEPTSAALVGMGALMLTLRRRRNLAS